MKMKTVLCMFLLLVLICSFNGSTAASAWSPRLQPKPREISFDHYHTYSEMVRMLKTMRCMFPRLMQLYPIGESFLGKKIWAVEITNRFYGPRPSGKPGFLFLGEHHGDEVIAKEVALYFIWYLLTNYGKDPRVTYLLNTRTVYVIPLVNPDGNDLTLLQGQCQRLNARPLDEDLDGLFDEDPPEDINGDGIITEMRKWDETLGDYIYFPFEGVDNDGDGMVNEDFIGGVDLNRNYEYGWQPFPWDVPYFGEYPFSEPETQAVRNFVLAHPNIATGFDTHSGAQIILYPWSHTFEQPPDANTYETLSQKYSSLTGYPYGQTPYVLYPCTGTTMDWMYGSQGIIHFTNEVFGPYYFDPEDPFDFTEFIEAYPDVEYPWQEFEHPQLGTVEIGGFWFFRFYNPPENEILEVCERNLPMVLNLVEVTPDLEITSIGFYVSEPVMPSTVTRRRPYFPYRDITISIELTNQGFLNTSTQHALQSGIAQPVTVKLLVSPNAKLVEGNPVTKFDMLQSNQTVGVSWKIRVKVPSISWALVTASTPKGGTEKLLMVIKALPRTTTVITVPIR